MYAIRSYYGENANEAEKRAALAAHLDSACDLTGKLDEESIIISQSIVRTQSPAFPLIAGEENIFGYARITSYNVCYTKLLRFWFIKIIG